MSRKEVDGSLQYSVLLVKAVCVMAMVSVHSVFEFISIDEVMVTGHAVAELLDGFLGGLLGIPPLLIPMTAACVLRLRWDDYFRQPRFPKEAWASVLGVVVLLTVMEIVLGWVLGYLSNPYRIYPYTFDALQLIAVSFLLIAILAVAPRWSYLVASALILALPLVVTPATDSFLWLLMNGDPDRSFYWPPIPWVGGSLFAFWFVDRAMMTKTQTLFWIVAMISSGLIAMGLLIWQGAFLTLDPGQIWGRSVFAATWYFVLELACLLVALLGLGFFFHRYLRPSAENPFLLFGRGIFWIYPFHLLFIALLIPPLRNVGVGECLRQPAAHEACLGAGSFAFVIMILAGSWTVAYLAFRFLQKTRYTFVLRKRRGTKT